MANATIISTLEYIFRRRQASRVEIARHLNLSRAALTAAVNNLIAENLVRESGTGSSCGGKPPVMLEIKGSAFTVAAIDIGSGRMLRGTLCDASGTFLKKSERIYSQDHFIDDICELALQLVGRKHISAMGVSVSGIVDTGRNIVLESANFPLAHSGIAKILSEKLGIPVLLGNRSRLAASYEGIYGTACGRDDFLYVSLGKSIGSALCSNGIILEGVNHAAGEIRNFKCSFENRTLTLETLLSESFLLEQFNSSTLEELVKMWESDDHKTTEKLKSVISSVAQVLAYLIEFTDTALLIPGGRFRHFGSKFRQLFTSELIRYSGKNSCEIIFSDAGEDAPLYGAAILAIRYTLQNLKTNRKGLEK